MTRQKPRQHSVKAHIREGTPVRSYRRGILKQPKFRKRDYVPSYLEETEYLPNTTIPIKWERMGGPETSTRVWMTPEEFLGYTTPPDEGKEGFNPGKIESIRKDLTEKGEPMYSPYLDVRFSDNQVTGHEGRHRAYWAMMQGIRKIPVYIVWEDNRGHLMGETKTKFGKLKPQGFYEREKMGLRYRTHSFYSALDVAEGVPVPKIDFPIKPEKKHEEDKPLPKLDLELTPEQRLRLYKMRMQRERNKPHNLCPECASNRTIRDYSREKGIWRICLSCGKEFEVHKT